MPHLARYMPLARWEVLSESRGHVANEAGQSSLTVGGTSAMVTSTSMARSMSVVVDVHVVDMSCGHVPNRWRLRCMSGGRVAERDGRFFGPSVTDHS